MTIFCILTYLVCRVRTSSGMFLKRGRDKIIRDIEKRIADFTFIPVGTIFSEWLTPLSVFLSQYLCSAFAIQTCLFLLVHMICMQSKLRKKEAK